MSAKSRPRNDIERVIDGLKQKPTITNSDLEVKITTEKGRGVYAGRNFTKGEYILEYEYEKIFPR